MQAKRQKPCTFESWKWKKNKKTKTKTKDKWKMAKEMINALCFLINFHLRWGSHIDDKLHPPVYNKAYSDYYKSSLKLKQLNDD